MGGGFFFLVVFFGLFFFLNIRFYYMLDGIEIELFIFMWMMLGSF